ncbi:TetR/AcrR family transcriptional regulator [Kutzneria sp. CA-103260]|uniref:TetR/AcrR family transcriptional regulator n=1 Tax=Kutzneria sp. CA-103260 TaxID=2802641 RepID=UPI001BF046CC|nr:TetR/AcrR family transcriptional regulator [Kutzneria sp. CA-103260]QUQ66530.1 TetR family transcriptional regulator [Kutzneria sp. CA-103260]
MASEQRRAQRRQRLLEAALHLFTTLGYRQTKIVQICADAGVSTRNFYEEFTGKEQLLVTLHDLINSAALEQVRTALAKLDSPDVVTRITVLLDAFVASVTADPRLPRLNYVEAVGVSEELERQHQEWVTRWADFIESEARHAAAHGVAPDRDYRLTAIALVGAITGLLREWQAHRPPWPVADIAAEIRGVMLAAILR